MKYEGVRYVRMPRTEYKMYYVMGENEVVILTIWGSRRRRGPKL